MNWVSRRPLAQMEEHPPIDQAILVRLRRLNFFRAQGNLIWWHQFFNFSDEQHLLDKMRKQILHALSEQTGGISLYK